MHNQLKLNRCLHPEAVGLVFILHLYYECIDGLLQMCGIYPTVLYYAIDICTYLKACHAPLASWATSY